VPVEPEVTFMLDRLAPFFGGASGDATIDDAFGVGFDFISHRVEAALGPTAFPAARYASDGFSVMCAP
jgi:hypothetical protein